MKQFLKLQKIIVIILIFSSINIFEGCTSIQETAINDIGYDLFEIDKNNKTEENITKDQNKNNEIIQNNTKIQTENKILNYDEVKDQLIRFHVIANSDKDEDQNLKLEVKNKVIDYLYPYLNASQSLDESRKIINDKMYEVKNLAEQVIKDNNYKYGVKVELSRENFPEKSYGKITLPQGNYEAFRIIIGAGQGKNWWCVMFPPLCFVDETKAEVEYDKTENRLNSKKDSFDLKINLNSDEAKSENADIQNNNKKDLEKSLDKQDNNEKELDKQENNKAENKDDVQIKLKIVEIFKSLFN